jgi:hypothetical protein
MLFIPAIIYLRSRRNAGEWTTAENYLVLGLIVLGIAAAVSAMWLIKTAP